jgi:hypothetical protein
VNYLAAFILRVAAQRAWCMRGVRPGMHACVYAFDDAASFYEQGES